MQKELLLGYPVTIFVMMMVIRIIKYNFNKIIQKQTNHLINEIDNSKLIENKLIGCASIILVGLCYQK